MHIFHIVAKNEKKLGNVLFLFFSKNPHNYSNAGRVRFSILWISLRVLLVEKKMKKTKQNADFQNEIELENRKLDFHRVVHFKIRKLRTFLRIYESHDD